ncbi:MAG: hypothetical protein AB1830_06390 [Pseudomonadota bacterium]
MNSRSAVLLFLLLAAVPPGWAAEFQLQLKGAPATAFSGTCELVEADGSVASVRIEGTVPAHYRFNGRAVSVHLSATGGSLTAHLYQDGRLVGQGMAGGDRGHVALSAGAAPGGKGRGYGYGGAPGR